MKKITNEYVTVEDNACFNNQALKEAIQKLEVCTNCEGDEACNKCIKGGLQSG